MLKKRRRFFCPPSPAVLPVERAFPRPRYRLMRNFAGVVPRELVLMPALPGTALWLCRGPRVKKFPLHHEDGEREICPLRRARSSQMAGPSGTVDELSSAPAQTRE